MVDSRCMTKAIMRGKLQKMSEAKETFAAKSSHALLSAVLRHFAFIFYFWARFSITASISWSSGYDSGF